MTPAGHRLHLAGAMGLADEIRGRRSGTALSAERLFTNRTEEAAAFEAHAARVRSARLEDPGLVLDLRTPRRNVLTYFGHGGIGKTRLSRELQERFGQSTSAAGRHHSIRIDFSEPSARDPELYLLSLRAGLAPIANSLPAFDIVLAMYWSRQHPGTSISEFIRDQSSLGSLFDRRDLADGLDELVSGLLSSSGLVVGVARTLAAFTWKRIHEARTVKRLERDCPFFGSAAKEEDLDELRLHMPILMGWELSRLQALKDLDVSVFLDTYERISSRRNTQRAGDLEDAVARSAFYLPTLQFVITGRDRLDWGSDRRRASLEYAGPECWPGLAESDSSDQHRVGVLSKMDCEAFLEACLVDDRGDSAIPPDLRREIAERSEGVPLYLDVAVNHFRGIVARGRRPTLEDFARGIPEIVLRLMEDLPDDEADLLRIAALLRVFDRETLRVALPGTRSSSIEHFVDRSIVLQQEDSLYSVHELLQTSVRLEDAVTSNPWHEDEWEAAEVRLVEHWSHMFADETSLLWRDRRVKALALWQLAGLYATTTADVDVLAGIIMQVQLQGSWAAIEASADQPDGLLTKRGTAFLRLIDGLMARQIGNLEDADRLLDEALAPGHLGGDLQRLAAYYLANTRDVRVGDPVGLYVDVARKPDRLGRAAELQLGHHRLRERDLVGALDVVRRVQVDQSDVEFAFRLAELEGAIWLAAGDFRQSARVFRRSKDVAVEASSALFMALAERHTAMALSWYEPTAALTIVDDAESLNRDLGLKPGVGQCLMARATALVGHEEPHVIDDLLERSYQAFVSADYRDDALGPLAVAIFAARARGDEEATLDRYDRIVAESQGRRVRHWLAVAGLWADRQEEFERVSWPQGVHKARQDWLEVLRVRVAG